MLTGDAADRATVAAGPAGGAAADGLTSAGPAAAVLPAPAAARSS